MTAMEQLPHLYTVGEYAALGETEYRTELQEGAIVMSPRPAIDHMDVVYELAKEIEAQLPKDLKMVIEIDVDLELAPPTRPGTVRQPDLVVVDRAAYRQAKKERKMVRASDVRLMVEIVSPGSHRMDYKIKRSEYADAGIPHYWILDLNEPTSLLACTLVDGSRYVDSGEITGTFRTNEPFPFVADLDALSADD